MTRILMVDDHQLFLDGMRQLLSRLNGPVDVISVDNAEQALTKVIDEPTLDLILLDLGMPNLNGHEFIQALVGRQIFTPVAVISASDNPNDVARVMDAGAFAFIHKSTPADEMLMALKQVLAGDLYLPPNYQKPENNNVNTSNGELTPRQMEVLQLLAQGHPNKRIATILNLSEETVKTHLRALFDNLNVHNRTECVTLAIQNNLIT